MDDVVFSHNEPYCAGDAIECKLEVTHQGRTGPGAEYGVHDFLVSSVLYSDVGLFMEFGKVGTTNSL